jgi:Zn finger protein HypA/HybF involved in hydrogenase expression
MCYICGCSYFTIDDLVWYKYRCTQCDLVYQSTGKISICPRCRSQDVKEVLKGSGKDKTGSTKKTSKKRK